MAERTPQDMADHLLAASFSRSGPDAERLSPPITETPMVVSLDELRPYELDPRLTRNPLYDDIKASIRARGLDAPPSITRRPDADHYIIRNGGNTRLAILRELWSETKDERFFRIACRFHPWPARGEIVALTGHLAENELHGGLTFIERALGVEKARELYELEGGGPLSQSELARRLAADGYPIPQSHISRMQDTVRYLLPTIPNVLYKGLGRHQVERLAVLRKSAELVWAKQAHGKSPALDFETLFQEVLTPFDTDVEGFSVTRVQDELIGQMAAVLHVDYNVMALDVDNINRRQRVINQPPPSAQTVPSIEIMPSIASVPSIAAVESHEAPRSLPGSTDSERASISRPTAPSGADAPPRAAPAPVAAPVDDARDAAAKSLQEPIVSAAVSTERLQTIQRLVAEHTGETPPADAARRAIPIQVDGLFPITDIWTIEPGLDAPDRLRIHIAQFAREIAEEADVGDCIDSIDAGLGFACVLPQPGAMPRPACRVFEFLCALSLHHAADDTLLTDGGSSSSAALGALLVGAHRDAGAPARLSDDSLVKFFRLVRLARRLFDLEAAPVPTLE